MKLGMGRKDALRAVRLEQGTLEVTKEVVRSAGWESFVETCWQDLRFGARSLAKNPAFAAVAILTLALGVGANTTIFSIIHAVLLTPLPYRDSGRLVVIYDRETRATGLSKLMDLYRDFKEYREHSRSFDRLAGMTWVRGKPHVDWLWRFQGSSSGSGYTRLLFPLGSFTGARSNVCPGRHGAGMHGSSGLSVLEGHSWRTGAHDRRHDSA